MTEAKKSYGRSEKFGGLQKFAFVAAVSLFVGVTAASQVTAAFYGYPSDFGKPLFYWGDMRFYQPMQFLLWSLLYPSAKGIYWGWVTVGGVGGGITGGILFWLSRKNAADNTRSLYGSSDWGDPNNPQYGLRQKHGVVLGQDAEGNFIVDNRDTHVMIAASTGSGKSAGPAVLTLLNYQESVIVADVKGELSEYTAGHRSQFSDIHIFNPLSPKSPTKINPLLEVREGNEAIADCSVLADALLPDSQSKASDEHWILKSREWVKSMLLYTLHCEKRENVHLAHLYNLLALGFDNPTDGFAARMRRCVVPRHADPKIDAQRRGIEKYIRTTADTIAETNKKEGSSIVSTLTRHLEPFRNPIIVAAMKESTLSLRSLMFAKRPQTLYLTSPPGDMQQVAPIIRVIFEMTSRIMFEEEPRRADTGEKSSLMLRPGARSIFQKIMRIAPAAGQKQAFQTWPKLKDRHNLLFMLDEAPRYGRLHAIEGSISLIRSYGGRIVLISQATTMLERIYGKDSDIFVNCGVKLFLAVSELEEAKKVSAYAGITTRSFVSQGVSKNPTAFMPSGINMNQNYVQRQLINPDEVMQLTDADGNKMAILIVEGLPPMKIRRALYFEHERFLRATEIKFSERVSREVAKYPWHDIIPPASGGSWDAGGGGEGEAVPGPNAARFADIPQDGPETDSQKGGEARPAMTPIDKIYADIPSQGGMQEGPGVESQIVARPPRNGVGGAVPDSPEIVSKNQINNLVKSAGAILSGERQPGGNKPRGGLWGSNLKKKIGGEKAAARNAPTGAREDGKNQERRGNGGADSNGGGGGSRGANKPRGGNFTGETSAARGERKSTRDALRFAYGGKQNKPEGGGE